MGITSDLRINTSTNFYLQQNPCIAPASHLVDFVATHAAGKMLLDFGCGIGAYSFELRQRGFSTIGVDNNSEYIDISRENGGDVRLLDGCILPFPDKSFDTTFFLEVLEHLPDEVIRSVLLEARRVTRSNLLITVPDNSQYQELISHNFMFGHYHAVDHIQFFTVDNISKLLQEFFPSVKVKRGEPIFPHRLLPPLARKVVSAMYRLRMIRPTIHSRLFIEAKVESQ